MRDPRSEADTEDAIIGFAPFNGFTDSSKNRKSHGRSFASEKRTARQARKWLLPSNDHLSVSVNNIRIHHAFEASRWSALGGSIQGNQLVVSITRC